MVERCVECGDTGRPLTADRVCSDRGGCEHRIRTHDGEMRRLYQQMALLDPLPCGHNELAHARMRSDLADFWQQIQQGYGD